MRLHILLGTWLIAAPVSAIGTPVVETTSAESIPADAADAVDAFAAALRAARMDEVRQWLDPDVQVYESGHVESGRDAYFAEHAAADAKFLGSAQVVRESRTGGASGDLAWVTTRSTVAREGKRHASIETMVLRRGPEGWRIVHIHWSSRALPAD